MIGIDTEADAMTVEQHAEVRRRLAEAGVSEAAMRIHTVFGEEAHLLVFEIWQSQEAWDDFLAPRRPIPQDLGITMSEPPTIMAIVDLVT